MDLDPLDTFNIILSRRCAGLKSLRFVSYDPGVPMCSLQAIRFRRLTGQQIQTNIYIYINQLKLYYTEYWLECLVLPRFKLLSLVIASSHPHRLPALGIKSKFQPEIARRISNTFNVFQPMSHPGTHGFPQSMPANLFQPFHSKLSFRCVLQ